MVFVTLNSSSVSPRAQSRGLATQSLSEESAKAEILRLRVATLRMTTVTLCHPELVEGSRLPLSHSRRGECRGSFSSAHPT